MPEPILITGTVRGPNGKPISGARCFFTDGPVAFPEIAAITDDQGVFSLTAPAAGKWVVSCAADDLSAKTATVKVSGGKPARLDFQLER